MALIESEEAAGRLARVIASDIQLYNKKKIETGADLSAEVEEGFRLFRSRVAPSLLPVFESVLTDKGLLGGKTPPPRISPLMAAMMPPAADTPPVEVTPPVEATPPVAAPPPVAASAPPAPRYDAPTEPSAPAVASEPVEDLPAAPEAAPQFYQAFTSRAADGPLPPDDEPSATEERPTFEAARRLARVIISDIRIYNPKKIEAGESLTAEIEEGRKLFKARIGADLLPLFESVLEETGLVKKAAPKPAPAPIAVPVPAPMPAPAPVAAAEAAPAPSSFPFDEPTQALDDHPVYGREPVQPRVPTPVPPHEAAAALSRVNTPFPGEPLRTPTPFLEGPIMVSSHTPGPGRRGLPPPIPVAARTLKPVPLPGSVTPPPVSAPPPAAAAEPVSPLGAPAPMPAARFPVVGVPDAAPVAVTTSHRRKPPIRLAVAAATIATALGLAYVLFQM